MALSTDILLDRMKLKSRLGLWRFIALICLIALILLYTNQTFSLIQSKERYIARISINDVIFEDVKHERILKKLKENDSVKAVIVHINSPGGTEVGSEILYQSIREIAQKKPVVALMGTIAASGGYLVALAADQIFAR